MRASILLLITIATTGFSQKKVINDWEKLELMNSPKSVNTTFSDKKFEKVTFNRNGFITEEFKDCGCEKKTTNQINNTYSTDNKLVGKVELQNGVVKEHITYTYDANGNVKRTFIVSKDYLEMGVGSIVPKDVKKIFNDKDQLIEKLTIFNSKYSKKDIYSYDKKGNWVRIKSYSNRNDGKGDVFDFETTRKIRY